MTKSLLKIKTNLRVKRKRIFLAILIVLILLGVAAYAAKNIIIDKKNDITKINVVKIKRLGKVYAFGFVNTGISYDIFAYNTKHEVIKLISVPTDDAVTAIEYDSNKLYIARESGIQYIDLTSDDYKLENLIKVDADDDKNEFSRLTTNFWLDSIYVYNKNLYFVNGNAHPIGIVSVSLNETNLFKNQHMVLDNTSSPIFKIDKKKNRIYFNKSGLVDNGLYINYLYYKDLNSGAVALEKSDSKGEKIVYSESNYKDNAGLYFFDPKTQENTLISYIYSDYVQIGDNVYYANGWDNKIHKYNLDSKSEVVIYENLDKNYNLEHLSNAGNNLIEIASSNEEKNGIYKTYNWSIKYIDLNGNPSLFTVKDLNGKTEEYNDSRFKLMDFTIKYVQ